MTKEKEKVMVKRGREGNEEVVKEWKKIGCGR